MFFAILSAIAPASADNYSFVFIYSDGTSYPWDYEHVSEDPFDYGHLTSNWVGPTLYPAVTDGPPIANITTPVNGIANIGIYKYLLNGLFYDPYPSNFSVGVLNLDSGPNGALHITPYQSSSLSLNNGQSTAEINVIGSDAGDDVISCGVVIESSALDVTGGTLAISGPISGQNLIVDCTNLELSGANTHAGTVLRGGTLTVLDPHALGSGSLDFQGGELILTVPTDIGQYWGVEASGGAISVAPGTTSVLGGAVLSAAGSLHVSGGGTLRFESRIAYGGGLVVDHSTLGIASSIPLGDRSATVTLNSSTLLCTASASINAHITLSGGSSFSVAPLNELTAEGAIDGTGGLTVLGGGSLSLTDLNSFLGDLRVTDGSTVRVGNDLFLGDPSDSIVLDNGTLRADSSFSTYRAVSINGGTVDVDDIRSLLIGSQISGAGLTKTGGGELVLTHANSFTSGVSIEGGVLTVNADSQLGDPANSLSFNGGSLNAKSGFTTSRSVFLNAGGGQIMVDDQTGTVVANGLFSGPGSLAKSGPGTLVLTNTGNSYGGETDIIQGTLQIAADQNLGSPTTLLSILGGSNVDSVLNTTADITMSRFVYLGNPAARFDVNAGTTLVLNGVIAGSGGLVKSGLGSLVVGSEFMGQTSNYSGATVVDAGTLKVTSSIASTSSATVNSGARLVFADGATGGLMPLVAAAGGTIDISGLDSDGLIAGSIDGGGAIQLGGKTLTFGGSGANTNFAGVIADGGLADGSGGSTVKTGAGTTTLSGINTYTGPTTVDAGTLNVTGSIARSSQTIVNTGGILSVAGGTISGLTNNGSVSVSGASPTINGDVTNQAGKTINISGNATFAGSVTNSGTFKTTGATATFDGTFTNNGIYTSDPSTQNFQNLTIGTNGALVGGLGDIFNVRGNLINNSTQNTVWDTHLSQVGFNASGPHQLNWTGTEQGRGNTGFVNNFATGIFVLPSAATLATSGGGALYTRVLQLGDGASQIASITGNGLNIHYNPGSPQNAYLNFQTYALPSGFVISPAAAPADVNAVWNGTTGNWSDATRWSSGVAPLNLSNTVTLYDATINAGTATLDQTIGYIQKLNLGSGGTLSGPNAVTPWDTFTWGTVGNNNASTINGGAVVNANGDLTIVGDSARNLDNATINNHAGYNATWAAGNSDLNFSNNAAFNNYGAFLVQNNRGMGRNGGTGMFNNYGTFTKNTGTGTTNIGSANFVFSNTGSISVQTGTLEFDGPLTGPATASVAVVNGGALVIADQVTPFAGSIANAGPLNVGDAIGAAGSAVLLLQVNNQIANSSLLTVKSDGLLDINNLSECIGALAASGGTISIGSGTLLPSSLSMSGGSISGTGSGTLRLASGVTAVADSTGNPASISSQIDLNSATRTFTVDHGPAASDLVISGNVSNGGLSKAGVGIMMLTGVSSYVGATTVDAGRLAVSGAIVSPSDTVNSTGTLAVIAAGTIGNARVSVNAGGIFDISGSTIGGVTVGSIEGAGQFELGANMLTFGALGTDTIVSGVIADGGLSGGVGGSLVKVGPGMTTLTANNTFSGSASVNSGTLKLDGATFPGDPVTVSDGALLTFVNGASAGAANVSNQSGSSGGQTTFNSNATAASATITALGGAISGSVGGRTIFNSTANGGSAMLLANGGSAPGAGGGMTIFNDGSTTAAALLTTNGGTNGGSGALTETIGNVTGGSNQVVTNAGGTFEISQLSVAGITVGSIEGAGTYRLGSKALTFGSLNSNKLVSGLISDGGLGGGSGGSLIKVGFGTTTLSGPNSYSGGTMLQVGGLNINSTTAIGTGLFSISGGTTIDNTSAGPLTLTTNNAQSWLGSFTFTGTQSLNFGSGAVTLNSNPFVTVSANVLTIGPIGNGTGSGLTKLGAGTLYVNGGASYTGTTSVTAGTMTISGGPFASSASTVAAQAEMNFINGANAGSGTFSDQGSSLAVTTAGLIQFRDPNTTAGFGNYMINGGTGTVQSGGSGGNGATIAFFSGTTADHATITVQGAPIRYAVTSAQALFNAGSTAGNASITTNGGSDGFSGGPAPGGLTLFSGNATAGAATLVTSNGSFGGLPGLTEFKDMADAGTANLTINNGATNKFINSASAAEATINVNGGGTADFENSATASGAMLTIASNGLATFINGATGGSATLMNTAGGQTQFHNAATGGSANITNMDQLGGAGTAYTRFYDTATAGSATITNRGGQEQPNIRGGYTEFHNSSSAGSASITNLGATASNGAFGGETDFYDSSNAGTAAMFVNGGGSGGTLPNGGVVQFFNSSAAGSASFINNASTIAGGNNGGGYTYFNGGTTADHASLVNNGGATSGAQDAGHTIFNSGSTADHVVIIDNPATTSVGQAGETDFNPGSTGGNATITNNGSAISGAAGGTVQFNGQSGNQATAGNAMIIANGGTANGAKGGYTYFGGSSNAGTAIITTNGGTVSAAQGAITYFDAGSSAASAMIVANGAPVNGAGSGLNHFFGSAGSATVIANGGSFAGAGGATSLFDFQSSAGSAMLIANGGTNGGGGGLIQFLGQSSGGSARVVVNAGALFDDSFCFSLTVGSIEGAGRFQLGLSTLTCGSLNTDTIVSGLLVDGGINGNTGASLVKQGSGKLTLTGANTYTGPTTINGGTISTALLANGGAPSGVGRSASDSSNLIVNGGTLQYTGPTVNSNRLFTIGVAGGGFDASGSGPLTLSNTGPIGFTGSGSRTLTLTGSNTSVNSLFSSLGNGSGGPTSLVKSGAGTWALGAANSFNGGTTIVGGTLRINADMALGALPGTPINNLTFSGSGTLQAGTGINLAANRQVAIASGVTASFDTDGNSMTIAGTINDSGTLAKSGLGTLEIDAAPTFAAVSAVQVNAGKLTLKVTSGSPSVGSGVTATVANGATLELAGSVSALGTAGGNRASIANNSTSGGLLVSGIHQLVGAIDGTGSTQVNAGSDLTANHIIQSALVIGGTSASLGVVTIDASDASGYPLAGESPTLIGADNPIAIVSSALGGSDLISNSLASGDSLALGQVSGVSTTSSQPSGQSISAVPEPSTLALECVALVFLVLVARGSSSHPKAAHGFIGSDCLSG
jgi:autotransporter-associated beta strand protein